MHELRWGSIGCGDVMEVKSGPALQKVQHSELRAVMRRNGRLAADFARRHSVPQWYDQAEDLIDDPEINAIYIATPPNTHLYYARLAAQAGKPVYVEKPMANSYAECQEMIQICQTHQVPLFVAYYRRALPRFLQVKTIIDSGLLGSIREVKIQLLQQVKAIDKEDRDNWRVIPEIAGCGYFCDLASHIFDLLQFMLGEITSATGSLDNTGGHYIAEDQVRSKFKFKNGVTGTGLWDFNAQDNLDRTEIIGSRGSVAYSHFTDAAVTLATPTGVEQFQIPNPIHIQEPLIQTIVNELRGQGTCPSTGVNAAKTNWILDQILGR